MKKKIYAFCLLISVVALMVSCDKTQEVDMNTDIEITGKVGYTITINNIKVKISNSQMKLGEELIIEGSNDNNNVSSMTIQCASLDIDELLQTPFVYKKKMYIEGRYTLVMKSGNNTYSVGINVTK